MNFGIQTNNIASSTEKNYGFDVVFNNGAEPMSFYKNEDGEWDYDGSQEMFDSIADAIDDYVTYNTEA